MLTKTLAYYEAEQAGKVPLFYAYVGTDVTVRCFLFKGTASTSGGTGFWDGSRYVGDGITYGSTAGVSQTEYLLLSISPINQGTTQSVRGLLTSLSASNVGHVSITLDNAERFFSNLISGEAKETFLNGTLEIRQGFEGLSYGDQLSLFKGTIIDAVLEGASFKISADAISSTLYDVYELPKSSLYTTPENDNTALPMIFGNIAENSNQGVVVCPQIDTVTDVYALACHPIQTELAGNTITLYDSDGVIDSGDYTINASVDYESTGFTIATATFSTPPNGNVTAKMTGGAVNDAGTVLTNPVDVIEKMLSIMGDSTNLEPTSKADASQAADDANYTCAGIIIGDQPKSYWITDILSTFLGSWALDENGQIVIQIDTGNQTTQNTAADLKQYDCTSQPRIIQTRDNLITRAILNYAYSAAQIDKRFKNDALTNYLKTYSREETTGDISQEFSLNWTRNDTSVENIALRIESLYGTALNIYNWKTTDFTALNVEPGDFIAFSNDWHYDDNGNPLSKEIGRVINVTRDISRQTLSLDFYDTGNYLLCTPAAWNGDRWVGDGLMYGGCRIDNPDPTAFLFDGDYYFDGSETFDGEIA